MTDDRIFRLTLLIGFVIFVPPALRYRLKSRTSEKLDRRQEGLFILITLRLMGLAGMAGLIAYFIHPDWMGWAALSLPVWLRWAGLADDWLVAEVECGCVTGSYDCVFTIVRANR